jgi:hypothetical protein
MFVKKKSDCFRLIAKYLNTFHCFNFQLNLGVFHVMLSLGQLKNNVTFAAHDWPSFESSSIKLIAIFHLNMKQSLV